MGFLEEQGTPSCFEEDGLREWYVSVNRTDSLGMCLKVVR